MFKLFVITVLTELNRETGKRDGAGAKGNELNC
jgi:hypothetical protein